MPSKEEEFRRRFATIVADMQGAAADPEALLLIGSLAQRLIDTARRPDWRGFKATLSRQDYSQLLTSFQNQGNALARQGAHRQVHAIEVLACSLIARTQADPEVAEGDRLLDGLIEAAIGRYRDSQAADPVIS